MCASFGDVGKPVFTTEDLMQVADGTAAGAAMIGKLGAVGDAVLDLLLDLRSFFTQQNGITVRLRHLALVHAEQFRRRCEKRLWLNQYRIFQHIAALAKYRIEAPHNFAGQLDMDVLVFTDRNKVRAIDDDIGSHE